MLDDKRGVIKRIIERTNVSKNTLYRYWNLKKGNKLSPPFDFMKVVADELGCSLDDLIND